MTVAAPAEPVDVSYAEVIEAPGAASSSGGGDIEPATAGADVGSADEPPDAFFDEPADVVYGRSAPPSVRRTAASKRGAIDLSVLDR